MYKKRRILKSGLAMIVAGSMSCCPLERNTRVNIAPIAKKIVLSERHGMRTSDELIEDYTKATLDRYIRAVVTDGHAPVFSGQVQSKGINTLINEYWRAHQEGMLDLAKKEKPTEEEFRNSAILVCKIQKQFSIMVNYEDKRVVEAQTKFVKEKVGNFRRLRNAKPAAMSFKELNAAAYSREEYADYVRRQNETSKELYGAMYESIGLLKRLGKTEIEAIRDRVIWIYNDSVDDLFSGSANP